MRRKLLAALTFAAIGGAGTALWVATAGSSSGATYEPVLDPANFVSAIDNPYYPLPVGRTLVYDGSRDGQTQTDTIKVLDQTKVIEGITARVVSDIATHDGTLLEKTFD